MPELPEVEVCRRGLLPELCGRSIRQVTVRQRRLRQPIPAGFEAALQGSLITDIRRRGKYLLVACSAPDGRQGHLIIHLGMSGNLRLTAPGTPAEKHDHVDIDLGDLLLRYSDPRRFGILDWHPAGASPHPLLAVLGMEPLTEDFTGDWLHAALKARRGPIKPVLMDSHLVVGIGNIYASESLFRAGISPLRAACRVSAGRIDRLREAIRQTLNDAIAAGGSSIRDYIHSDGGAGCFQIEAGVYDRAGQACRRCDGTVRQIRQAGRSTFYCPACQR